MATLQTGAVQVIQHDNYATSTTAATKTPTVPCNSLIIRNTDASISVLVSFDAGSTFFTIPAGQTLSLEVYRLKSYQIKSASGTPNVEALYGCESV